MSLRKLRFDDTKLGIVDPPEICITHTQTKLLLPIRRAK